MQKILKNIIFFLSCAILATPLFIDQLSIVPALFPKVIVFQLLVEASAIAWLFLLLSDSAFRPQWKHSIVFGFGFFIIGLLISLFWSLNPERSFWSTPEWMMGVAAYIHFYVWFLIITSVFREWMDWKRFFLMSVSVCALVSLYGFAQYLNFPFIPQADGKLKGRIISTIGNPIYFSTYVMMNSFFAFALMKRAQSFFSRYMLAVTSIFFLVLVALAASRGVVLAFSLALLFVFFVRAITAVHRWKKFLFIVLSLFIFFTPIAAIIVFSGEGARMWAEEKLPPSFQRLITKPFQDNSRLVLYKTAWEGFLARPIAGWGHDNYELIFFTYVSPLAYGNLTIGQGDEYGNYKTAQKANILSEEWYDRAHNAFFEILSATGLLGLAASGIFLFTLVLTIIRALRKRENQAEYPSIAIISCALGAYMLANLTAFDTPMAYLMFVLGVGYIVFATQKPILRQSVSKKFFPIILAGIGAMVVFMTYSSIFYYKSRLAKTGLTAMAYDTQQSIRLMEKALRGFSPYHGYIRQELGLSALGAVKKFRLEREKEKKLLTFAIKELEKNMLFFPRDLESATLLASLERSAYSYDASYADRTISLMKKMNQLYPKRRDVLFELAEGELLRGAGSSALLYAKQAVSLDESRGDAHWLRARVLFAEKKYNKMFAEIERAKALEYPVYTHGTFFLIMSKLIPDMYLSKALEHTNSGYALFAQTLDYRTARYILFTRMGDSKNASLEREWLERRN